MSLKAFHLFFIAASMLMCLLVAAWGVQAFRGGAGGGPLALGVLCLALGGALAVYGVKVWKKLRELPR